MIEGAATMGLGSITGSGFLAAYALVLGADNFQIGMLAALPFITMPLQVLTVGVVERTRRRKLIAVPAWLFAQAVWFPIALIPLLLGVPSAGAVSLLLVFMAIRSILVASQNAAWNSWIRDLVPQELMGSIFASRLRYANIAAMVFGLGAAMFVDFWSDRAAPEDLALGYTYAILAGAAFLGLTSVLFRFLMPEPQMPAPEGERQSLLSSLAEPFKDPDYRPMLRFQFFWAFALHLATPFFAVYMLQRLGLPLSAVLGFTVLSQLFNVLFLRLWGPLVDRVGNKAVLSVSASLYLFVILGWTFTTMPERYFLTIPLLVVLHMLAGAAAAGATLTTGTIGLKMAPVGKGTAYVAAVSVMANVGAGIGPLLGGRLADFFSVRTLSLDFNWTDPTRTIDLPALHLTGFDFLFTLTFLIGLLTLNGLGAVKEKGELGREVVMDALFASARRATVPMSSVPGFGLVSQFPITYARAVPGLDVAMGVTAYQVAETTRMAAHAAARGRAGTEEGARRIREAVLGLWEKGGEVASPARDIARHAARGAMLTAEHVTLDFSRRTRDALAGVVGALADEFNGGKDRANAEEVIRAASYGAVQGAVESGATAAEAAAQVVDAASSAAQAAGVSQEQAAELAALGALDAVRDLAPGDIASAEQAVQRARMDVDPAEQDGDRLE
ncbi:MAG: MFS transporter [Dehalococcoidia bacterium]